LNPLLSRNCEAEPSWQQDGPTSQVFLDKHLLEEKECYPKHV